MIMALPEELRGYPSGAVLAVLGFGVLCFSFNRDKLIANLVSFLKSNSFVLSKMCKG